MSWSAKYLPSSRLSSGSVPVGRSSLPGSSCAVSVHSFFRSGSGCPAAMEQASNAPLSPPALVPAMTSTMTSRLRSSQNVRQRRSASQHSVGSGSLSRYPARRRRSISWATPLIHTASETPPSMTRARRSCVRGMTTSQDTPARTGRRTFLPDCSVADEYAVVRTAVDVQPWHGQPQPQPLGRPQQTPPSGHTRTSRRREAPGGRRGRARFAMGYLASGSAAPGLVTGSAPVRSERG